MIYKYKRQTLITGSQKLVKQKILTHSDMASSITENMTQG